MKRHRPSCGGRRKREGIPADHRPTDWERWRARQEARTEFLVTAVICALAVIAGWFLVH